MPNNTLRRAADGRDLECRAESGFGFRGGGKGVHEANVAGLASPWAWKIVEDVVTM